MKITFDDHPARVCVDGEMVPAVPDQRMIRLDGLHAGYCGTTAGRPVSMIRHYGEGIILRVRDEVTTRYGRPSSITQPPSPEEYQ